MDDVNDLLIHYNMFQLVTEVHLDDVNDLSSLIGPDLATLGTHAKRHIITSKAVQSFRPFICFTFY